MIKNMRYLLILQKNRYFFKKNLYFFPANPENYKIHKNAVTPPPGIITGGNADGRISERLRYTV